MSESTGVSLLRESDPGFIVQPRRRLALPIALGGGLSAAPVVGALQQDYIAGIIAGAPAFVVAMLIFFLVICPAVWSKSPDRQVAALTVLDRLLGRPSERPKQRRRRGGS
ncbi:hypothetical protein ACF1FY_21685 [Streptomyces althioticus]|uniref:hypothetical protein n=1 Tax=Streptomyces althioticus TaxID=83380 RepID=UPI0036FC2517